jgi:hypothetical protein
MCNVEVSKGEAGDRSIASISSIFGRKLILPMIAIKYLLLSFTMCPNRVRDSEEKANRHDVLSFLWPVLVRNLATLYGAVYNLGIQYLRGLGHVSPKV